jgi:hypothetical protein
MLYDSMNTKKTWTISLILIPISIITIIGLANNVYTSTNSNLQYFNNEKHCDHGLQMNMFDNDNTPKYIIGGGYVVMPVSPSTTDVLVSSCNYNQ